MPNPASVRDVQTHVMTWLLFTKEPRNVSPPRVGGHWSVEQTLISSKAGLSRNVEASISRIYRIRRRLREIKCCNVQRKITIVFTIRFRYLLRKWFTARSRWLEKSWRFSTDLSRDHITPSLLRRIISRVNSHRILLKERGNWVRDSNWGKVDSRPPRQLL